MNMTLIWAVALCAVVCGLATGACLGGDATPGAEMNKAADKLFADGNYREALTLYRTTALQGQGSPARTALQKTFKCMEKLGEREEMADVLDAFIAAHDTDWRALHTAALFYADLPSQAVLQDGQWVRTTNWHRDSVSTDEHDRIIALRLLLRSEAMMTDADPAQEKVHVYISIASHLSKSGRPLSRTRKTDLENEPDWTVRPPSSPAAAPVDADGNPIFYPVPQSWADAANDAERWRWALHQQVRLEPARAHGVKRQEAEFFHALFDVQTLDSGFRRKYGEGEQIAIPDIYAVTTLKDDETLARLSSGTKRFSLPEHANFIRMYQELTADPTYAPTAHRELAEIYQNRRQYARAAEQWRALFEISETDSRNHTQAETALRNITKPLGRLEPGPAEPAGTPQTIPYLHRNGSSMRLTARRLDVEALLRDMREYFSQSKAWQKTHGYLDNESPWFVWSELENPAMQKYIGEQAATAEHALELLPDHVSRRTDLPLPVTDAGVWLLTADMTGGNTSRAVVCLADLALVHKAMADRHLYYVADARSGEPVAGAKVSFFGVRTDDERRKYVTREITLVTDENGLAVLDKDSMKPSIMDRLRDVDFTDYWWLVTARAPDGRMAYLGFDDLHRLLQSRAPQKLAAWVVTDRPIYRTGHTVRYKAWVRSPDYAGKPEKDYTDTKILVRITNPRGEKVHEARLTADAFGGVCGEFAVPADAVLGTYSVQLQDAERRWLDLGSVDFRVEEYKKPEFSVSIDSPSEPLRLGQTGRFVVRAAYYFGAPVSHADVQWTLRRTAHTTSWTPPWRWAWLYGDMPWWRQPEPESEEVASGTDPLGPDGTLVIPLDTLAALREHGDEDHKYELSVEVVDQSRRMVAASSTALATRTPFTVTLWTNRGWYRTDREMELEVHARLPQGGGLAAQGTVRILRIDYADDGAQTETLVQTQPVQTNADGEAVLRFVPSAPGVYRFVGALTDAGGTTIESDTVATVRGAAGEGGFRPAELELTAEEREYAVGDTVRLALNAPAAGARVLFFARAERTGAKPKLLTVATGSEELELQVKATDQPNFFCEALCVYNGRTYQVTQEIFVPPAGKELTVTALPVSDAVLPGGQTEVELHVTGPDGQPVSAQCAVTIYDAAVEAVAGGSNASPIAACFWSWKRDYDPKMEHSLDCYGYLVRYENDVELRPIGIFGGREADYAYPRSRYGRMQMNTEMRVEGMPMAMMAKGMAYDEEADDSPMAEPVLRQNFADTALWEPAVLTDADGRARCALTMPDDLTEWKIRVWGMADQTCAGEGEASFVTRKNVIIRPQLPRFLTQTDQVVLSANLHNYLPEAKTARAELVLEGEALAPAAGTELTQTLRLEANGEARVDWVVDALQPGEAAVTMRLLTDAESDAARLTIPIKIHGARTVQNWGGLIRPADGEKTLRFTVPEQRLPAESVLRVSLSPTIAGQLLPALPYMIEYPYGCTEQTLNRFLPAVVVRQYLRELGLSLEDARTEQHPEAKGRPVYSDAELEKVLREGLARLQTQQNGDGGWGWFSGPLERSWPHTAAVVVHGLLAAREAGVAVPDKMLNRGLQWLTQWLDAQVDELRLWDQTKDEKHPKGRRAAGSMDAFVRLVLAQAGRPHAAMAEYIHRDRLTMPVAALAMHGIALHLEGRTEELALTRRNLEQYLVRDAENDTCRLKTPDDGWWWWYNDNIETQSWYLLFLSAVDPQDDAAPGVAKYLLRNRKNTTHWRSTRDTALAVRALTAFARATGETQPDLDIAVWYDGRQVLQQHVDAASLLQPLEFCLEGDAVTAGDHEVRIACSGAGLVCYGGGMEVFSLEDFIPAKGFDITTKRTMWKVDGTARQRLEPGATLRSGDTVEAELIITAKNDYEYLVWEDAKAAGLESVELLSGYNGNELGAYLEYRDDRVVLFVRYLRQGTYTVRYRFRAQTPGRFSALPCTGGGMYATDLQSNSDEWKVEIVEEK